MAWGHSAVHKCVGFVFFHFPLDYAISQVVEGVQNTLVLVLGHLNSGVPSNNRNCLTASVPFIQRWLWGGARDQRLESLSEVRADGLANEYGSVFWAKQPHTQIYARIPNLRVEIM